MLLDEAVSIGFCRLEGLVLPAAHYVAEMATMHAVSSLDTHQPRMGARRFVINAGNAVHRMTYPI